MPNPESALAARFASQPRRARSFRLTVDTGTRVATLHGGGWRLYGASTQVYFQTRVAKSDGTVADGEQAAPPDATMVASTAGAAAGKAYAGGLLSAADSDGAVRGAIPLPTDSTQFEEIAVPPDGWVNLYLRVVSGTANPILVGPFE